MHNHHRTLDKKEKNIYIPRKPLMDHFLYAKELEITNSSEKEISKKL